MTEGSDKIFISYRRSASQHFALAVFKDLTYRKRRDVFYDINNVGPGEFERIILGQIKARAHFLAIMAPASMERLKNPDDWLRKEIEYAFDQKRNVIPVLHSGFKFEIHGEMLSGKLEALRGLQALTVPDDYFDEAMDRLVKRYLRQPFYGDIEETPEVDRAAVARKVAETQAEPEPTEAQLSAEDYFNLGYAAKDPQEKITYYSLAIEKNPDLALAYNNRGIAYANLKDHERAIADYDGAIQLDPDYAWAYTSRGNAYYHLKDYERAIADYDRAIQLDPDLAFAYNNRALANLALGKVPEAFTDSNRSLELRETPSAESARTHGMVHQDLGKFDEAIPWYEQAIALYEKSDDLDEDYEAAKRWLAQARARQPRE